MSKRKNINMTYFNLVRLGFFIEVLFTGGYYEFTSSISITILCVAIWIHLKENKFCFTLHRNDAMVAIAVVPLFYLLSLIWAIDRGLAVWGVVKHFPVFLFGICCAGLKKEEREHILDEIPMLGVVMTVSSLLLGLIPFFKRELYVAGRLGGFFLYPNTFAAFLAVGMIINVESLIKEYAVQEHWQQKERFNLFRLCSLVILGIGVLLTGSRAVFLLLVPILLLQLLAERVNFYSWMNKWRSAPMFLTGGVGLLLAVLFYSTGYGTGVRHLFNISINSSTLIGRFLYWKDALPIIFQHPLGLGYMGYYCMQGSFQHGVYSVRTVHNGILQLLLDIGWIPGLLLLVAWGRAIYTKHIGKGYRIALLFLLLHTMFDMDMDFLSIWFVALLCFNWDEMKSWKGSVQPTVWAGAALMGVAMGLYIGSTSFLYYAGFPKAASDIYPWNTFSNMELLEQEEPGEKSVQLADQILRQNPYSGLAWTVKARHSLSDGDVAGYIEAIEQALSLAKYDITGYEEYYENLRMVTEIYEQAGDTESVETCLKRIENIQTMLDRIREKTDPLAWKIKDQPELDMPEEYRPYLERKRSEN